MRFEPIKTLPGACPLFVEKAYDALIDKLGVTAWHWHVPRTGSELERFLTYGQSRDKRSDFHELRRAHGNYSFMDVFDHALCFKSKHSMQFALTMPYGDNISFYKAFDGFKADYYTDKERVAYAGSSLNARGYQTKEWQGQLYCLEPRFDATIVPNWFKVRENGDFAAIVAMDNQLRWLSELGGFPLVNADGEER